MIRCCAPDSPGTAPVSGHTSVLHFGVDDWAWKKRQNYGTILVNLDLHRVVDLLPDRAAGPYDD